jgi:hypothetical protein
MDQFGALDPHVWLGDPLTRICSQLTMYQSGGSHQMAEPCYEHHFEPASPVEVDALRPIQGRILIERETEFEALATYQEHRAAMRKLGVQTLIRVPFFFGSEGRGVFALRFATNPTLSPEEDGLAHMLANQVVLARE